MAMSSHDHTKRPKASDAISTYGSAVATSSISHRLACTRALSFGRRMIMSAFWPKNFKLSVWCSFRKRRLQYRRWLSLSDSPQFESMFPANCVGNFGAKPEMRGAWSRSGESTTVGAWRSAPPGSCNRPWTTPDSPQDLTLTLGRDSSYIGERPERARRGWEQARKGEDS